MFKEKLKNLGALFGKYAIAGLAFSFGAGIAIYAVWAFKGPTTGPGAGVTESMDKGIGTDSQVTHYYLTTSSYVGNTAGSACDAGYHMCRMDDLSRALVRDTSRGCQGSNCVTSYLWWDGDSNTTAAGWAADCGDWTSASGSYWGAVVTGLSSMGNYGSCNGSNRVICCKDVTVGN